MAEIYRDGSPLRTFGKWTITTNVINAIVQAANQYQIPAALLASLAAPESGFDPTARGYNPPSPAQPNGSYDHGLFQINDVSHPPASFPIDWSRIYDPFYNALLAADMLAIQYAQFGNWYSALSRWMTRDLAWNAYQDPWWRGIWDNLSGTTPTWAVEWQAVQIPTAMDNSRLYSVPVIIRNAGTSYWPAGSDSPVHLGYQWLLLNRTVAPGWPDADIRTSLPQDVSSGTSASVNMQVSTPPTPGSYIFQARLVKEGAFWFDQVQESYIQVVNASAPIPPGSPPGFGDRRLLATGAGHEIEQAAEIEQNSFAEGDFGEIEIDFGLGFLAQMASGVGQWLLDQGAVLWDDVRVEDDTMVIRFRKTGPVIVLVIAVLGFFFLMRFVNEWRLFWFPPKPPTGGSPSPGGGADTRDMLVPALAAGGALLAGVMLSRRTAK